MRHHITNAQIKALRAEAIAHGDQIQADLCDIALSGQDSDGTGTALGNPVTAEAARAECARVVAEARWGDVAHV